MSVLFLEEARDAFLEQISQYDEQQKGSEITEGVGDQFRESVVAATALASAHPNCGSP
jgi:hypothetical protein